jgi:arylsulfatase A-like enzyme
MRQTACMTRPGLVLLVAILLVSAGCSSGEGAGRADTALPDPPASTDVEVPAPRNVIVYLVDTLRASHLGLYGYPRGTSPRIDRFGRDGVIFDDAYSSSPWTRPSVATLFSGLHPETHGIHDKDDSAPDALLAMAEVFSQAGYETCGFSSNISVSEKFNMVQGFDSFTFFPHEPYFETLGKKSPGYVPVDGMYPEMAEWLSRPHEKPFFLYIHTTDPHSRYSPPAPYRKWGPGLTNLYDAEILFTDDYFGRFLDLLDQQGLREETLVIVTADHGEELGERGVYGHGHSLYNDQLRIPLVFGYPPLAPRRRGETVRLMDVFPTLVEWLELPVEPERMQGRSLMPLLLGRPDPEPRFQFVLGQIRFPSKIVGSSLQMDGFKILHVERDRTGKEDAWELYDVTRDRNEFLDLSGSQRQRLADYRARLESLQALTAQAAHPTEKTVLDKETEDVLRTLGYIQ